MRFISDAHTKTEVNTLSLIQFSVETNENGHAGLVKCNNKCKKCGNGSENIVLNDPQKCVRKCFYCQWDYKTCYHKSNKHISTKKSKNSWPSIISLFLKLNMNFKNQMKTTPNFNNKKKTWNLRYSPNTLSAHNNDDLSQTFTGRERKIPFQRPK